MLELLHAKNVEIWFRDSSSGEWPMQMLGSWAPLILLAALWFYMIRQLQTTQRQLSRRQDSQP
jgi:preprotein translocase subunit YajC